jgi:hypothetical protein
MTGIYLAWRWDQDKSNRNKAEQCVHPYSLRDPYIPKVLPGNASLFDTLILYTLVHPILCHSLSPCICKSIRSLLCF